MQRTSDRLRIQVAPIQIAFDVVARRLQTFRARDRLLLHRSPRRHAPFLRDCPMATVVQEAAHRGAVTSAPHLACKSRRRPSAKPEPAPPKPFPPLAVSGRV